MTINEKFGTNINTPHKERYGNVINAIGLDKLIPLLPRDLSREVIRRELERGNAALNGRIYVDNQECNCITLQSWDRAAGFICTRGKIEMIPSRLRYWLSEIGVTCYSNAECVCILKEAAKMYANS